VANDPPVIDATDVTIAHSGAGAPVSFGLPDDANRPTVAPPTNALDQFAPPPRLTAALSDLTAGHIAETRSISDEMEAKLAQDRHRMQQAYVAEGVSAESIPTWNEQEMRQHFSHNPMEAFGSLGSVFALVASAFTRQPMINGLNGAAAAMNAIKKNDDAEYDRAFDAFKTNADLAVKRFNMQHARYQDAMQFTDIDLRTAEAKMRAAAAQFGDQQSLAILDHWGMSPQLMQLQESRARQMTEVANATDKITKDGLRDWLYKRDPGTKSDDPNVRWETFNKYYGSRLATPMQELAARIINSDLPDDQKLEQLRKIGAITPKIDPQQKLDLDKAKADETAKHNRAIEAINAGKGDVAKQLADEKVRYDKAMEDLNTRKVDQGDRRLDQADRRLDQGDEQIAERERHNKEVERITAGRGDVSKDLAAERERHDKEMERIAAKRAEGGGGVLTTDRQIAADVEKARKEWKDQGLSDAEIADRSAQLTRRLRTEAAGMTGNSRDFLDSLINRIDYSTDTIDRVEAAMKKHSLITGLGGKITRPLESVANAIGLDSADDRRQFERDIAELQEWAGRLMNETRGRPLAVEAGRINTIIAGMRVGDTVISTAESLKKVKDLYGRMRDDLVKRRGGTFEPGDKSTPATTDTGQRPAWMDAQ